MLKSDGTVRVAASKDEIINRLVGKQKERDRKAAEAHAEQARIERDAKKNEAALKANWDRARTLIFTQVGKTNADLKPAKAELKFDRVDRNASADVFVTHRISVSPFSTGLDAKYGAVFQVQRSGMTLVWISDLGENPLQKFEYETASITAHDIDEVIAALLAAAEQN